MTLYRFGPRSLDALRGVDPRLVLVLSRALLYSEYDFAVTEGLRSPERQRDLLARGLSRTLQSKHLVQPDGYAHAVDLMAVGDLDGDGDGDAQDLARTWSPEIYGSIAAATGRSAEDLGIGVRWGGSFKSIFDGPHFELT